MDDDDNPVNSAEAESYAANRHEAVVGKQTKDTDREFDISIASV
jgi:hypothetical protein